MMMIPKFYILEQETKYTGVELRPLWTLEKSGIYGSVIVSFTGACQVETEKLVDMEDRLAKDFIKSEKMLHFIAEIFGIDLETGVFIQRLFMNHAEKTLLKKGLTRVERVGDDLMVGDAKLSVSIATKSVHSVLIHWGINIDPKGAPVKALGLNALNWDQVEIMNFAKETAESLILELQDIQKAVVKIRTV